VISTFPSSRQNRQGRLPIKTSLAIGEAGRERAYDLIRTEVAAGRRAFIVCPLIEDDDEGGVRSVETETRKLSSGPLRGLRIAALHGRLSAKEKDGRMESLAAGELDVVVATTVVEVGVDVPTATVILIEGAERFGLAQLHQLRGRVGRSSLPSYCLLAPTDGVADMSLSRLRVLEQTNDGFAVAEADLKFRGEGNLLGTNQSGEAAFRAAKADDLALMG
jgi:ATP-dependent DNA helicase RecG